MSILVLVQLARALHRQPLAQGHGEGPGEQAGHAGDEDVVGGQFGAGHAHDQAEVGDQPVVGAEDGGAQGVAAHGAVAALQTRDQRPLRPGGARARQLREHALVAALLGGHAGLFGLGLVGVKLGALGLSADQGGQHPLGPQPARHPHEHAGAPIRTQRGHGPSLLAELLAPELGVLLLDVGQVGVDARQVGVGLGVGEGAVDVAAVDFVLQTLELQRALGFGHGSCSRAQKWRTLGTDDSRST